MDYEPVQGMPEAAGIGSTRATLGSCYGPSTAGTDGRGPPGPAVQGTDGRDWLPRPTKKERVAAVA